MPTTSYGCDCILQRRTAWPGPSLLIPRRLSVDLVLYVINTQQTSLVSQGRGHVKLCPLRRRRRGERAPVKLLAALPLCRRSRRGRGHGSMADECLLPRDSAWPHPGAAGEYSAISFSPRANVSCRATALEDEPSPAVCGHCPF